VLLLHLPITTVAATDVWDFLLAWQLEPLNLAGLLVIGALYVVGRRRLVHHGGHPDGTRTWFFAAGLAALALALLSPIHTFSEELFSIHMIQHLLLLSVAPPLLLLANPMPTILWGLSPAGRQRLGRLLAPESIPIRMLKRLTRPVVAWWVLALNLWLWHQPGPYQAALESEPLHYLEHVCFFVAAVLFWWPVIGPAPLRSRLGYPARLLYVFLAWIPNSVLGAGITFAPSVLMPFYAARPRHWGIDPLTDQQTAGLLMWIPGDLVFAGTILALLVAALRAEERREAHTAAPL
jgi:cytochrome c oxidase assembly factor CtaG